MPRPMNRRQGFLALEGFMLDAGMQDSPSPDDFGGMDEPPEKPKAMPKKKPETKPFTYEDYVRMHCGNKAAAMYWYLRHEGKEK